MVVNNDRIDEAEYTPQKVADILKECRDRTIAAEVFGREDEEVAFLRHCLKYIDPAERDILERLYFDGVSVRRYSAISGFSRNFIVKQRDRSLELLSRFFNVKFNFGREE